MPDLVRVCWLYPELMNIYADRGNLIMLQRRAAWRGVRLEISRSGLGAALEGGAHDLYYLGGGQDRDQRLCADDLLALKSAGLREAAERGALILGVCGGYQLLGRSYSLGGERIEGVGLLEVETVREPGPRLIGNVAIELEHGEQSLNGILAGFENHGGRTTLGPGATALGRVLSGHGNDGRSRLEGAIRGGVIGTYLHGPLLPKNSWFADWLLARALGRDPRELPVLEDQLEQAAHQSALRAARISAA